MLVCGALHNTTTFPLSVRVRCVTVPCPQIRKVLMPDGGKWSLLGQSFGGFCACTYLSFYPGGLKEVLITGGLAPLAADVPGCSADTVYTKLFPRAVTQTNKLYKCVRRGESKRIIRGRFSTGQTSVCTRSQRMRA